MDQDKDFIVQVIQYLQNKYGIIFFITSKDFDVLYHWWEKRIPLRIVKESITAVVERWKEKKREIRGFSNFRYEVKKKFNAFLQLSIGSARDDENSPPPTGKTQADEIENFFNHYPRELIELRQDFEAIDSKRKNNEQVDLTGVFAKLSEIFKEDQELAVKTNIFLKNLSPVLRKPEIEQRYRLNYLINKFNIPDFLPED
jgi:hypothetical protein